MYLFDTNIVSELRRPKPHGGVLAWVDSVPNERIFISAASFSEIQKAIEALRPRDPEKAAILDAWADRLISKTNVLPMTGAIFRLWAKLMRKRSDAVYEDAMLAATAISHQLTMVTRNSKDFETFGCAWFNPFEFRCPPG